MAVSGVSTEPCPLRVPDHVPLSSIALTGTARNIAAPSRPIADSLESRTDLRDRL
jgi:hypothetical protein